jgi:hypothetical protein
MYLKTLTGEATSLCAVEDEGVVDNTINLLVTPMSSSLSSPALDQMSGGSRSTLQKHSVVCNTV